MTVTDVIRAVAVASASEPAALRGGRREGPQGPTDARNGAK